MELYILRISLFFLYNALLVLLGGAMQAIDNDAPMLAQCLIENKPEELCYADRTAVMPLVFFLVCVLMWFTTIFDQTKPHDALSKKVAKWNNGMVVTSALFCVANGGFVMYLAFYSDWKEALSCFNQKEDQYPNRRDTMMLSGFKLFGTALALVICRIVDKLKLTHFLEILCLLASCSAFIHASDGISMATLRACAAPMLAKHVIMYLVLFQAMVICFLTQFSRSVDLCLAYNEPEKKEMLKQPLL